MKIVVLAGGISTERDVSLVTGSMIYKALRKKGHNPVLLDLYLGCEDAAEDILVMRRRQQMYLRWAETGVRTLARSQRKIPISVRSRHSERTIQRVRSGRV